MPHNFNAELAAGYTSRAQISRIWTESWMASFGYCLSCTSESLTRTPGSTPLCDFVCPTCEHRYELKSKSSPHSHIVQDGGYDSMMRRMAEGNPPALLLLQYSRPRTAEEPASAVRLTALHPVFFTPEVVRKRPKPHVRPRTGALYQMCDLDLSRIPADGKITLLADGIERPHSEVRSDFKASERFAELPLKQRGWAALILSVIRATGKQHIFNADLYAQEATFRAAFPGNNNIRPKIRQQMQELEQLGYVERVASGEYIVKR